MGLIVTLENTYVYWLSLVIWGIATVFLWLGLKRQLFLNEEELYLKALLKVNRRHLPLAEIQQLQVAKNGILIITVKERQYCLLMGRRTSQRFLVEQANHPLLKDKIKIINKIDFLVD